MSLKVLKLDFLFKHEHNHNCLPNISFKIIFEPSFFLTGLDKLIRYSETNVFVFSHNFQDAPRNAISSFEFQNWFALRFGTGAAILCIVTGKDDEIQTFWNATQDQLLLFGPSFIYGRMFLLLLCCSTMVLLWSPLDSLNSPVLPRNFCCGVSVP